MKLWSKSKIARGVIITMAAFTLLDASCLAIASYKASEMLHRNYFNLGQYELRQMAYITAGLIGDAGQACLEGNGFEVVSILKNLNELKRDQTSIPPLNDAHEKSLRSFGKKSRITQFFGICRCLAELRCLYFTDSDKHLDESIDEILSNSTNGFEGLSEDDKALYFYCVALRADFRDRLRDYSTSRKLFKEQVLPLAQKLDIDDPDKPDVFYATTLYALALGHDELYTASLKEFETVKNLLQQRHASNQDLAEIYAYIGLTKVRMKNYAGGLMDLQMAIKLNPEEPWHYHHRAESYAGAKNYKDAIADLTHAIKMTEENAESPLNPIKTNNVSMLARAYRVRAQYYSFDKQDTLAMADIKHAISIEPSPLRGGIDSRLIDFYSKTGKTKEIIAEYQKAINKTPDDPNLYLDRAIYTRDHDPQSAYKDYDKVIKLCENAKKGADGLPIDHKFGLNLMPIYNMRAHCYEDLGQNEEALSLYEEAVKRFPYEVPPRMDKYRVLAKMHKQVDIKAECQDVFAKFPTKIFPWRFRAEQFLKEKDYKSALADYTTAIVLYNKRFPDPKKLPPGELSYLIYCYSDRAFCYEKTGQKQLAQQDRKTAMDLQTKFLPETTKPQQ